MFRIKPMKDNRGLKTQVASLTKFTSVADGNHFSILFTYDNPDKQLQVLHAHVTNDSISLTFNTTIKTAWNHPDIYALQLMGTISTGSVHMATIGPNGAPSTSTTLTVNAQSMLRLKKYIASIATNLSDDYANTLGNIFLDNFSEIAKGDGTCDTQKAIDKVQAIWQAFRNESELIELKCKHATQATLKP